MSIAPFEFREFGISDVEFVSAAKARSFLPTGRKKEEAPPPPPPPPTFSEENVKAAERDGYQRGFLDGIAEGKKQAETTQAEVDRTLGESVEAFVKQIAPLFAIYREMIGQQSSMLPKLAHGIAKKVAGDALDKNAYKVIEDICTRCVQAMMHEPKLVITLHESLKDTLKAKIAGSSSRLKIAGEIVVVGDANIALHNCRIEWQNGGMVRDTDALWQQVEQIVASMVASGEREAGELCAQMETVIMPPENTEPT